MNRPRHPLIAIVLSVAAVLFVAFPSTGRADSSRWFAEPHPRITFLGGCMQIFDDHKEACWAVQYHPAFRLWNIGPYLGIGNGNREEFYASAGIFTEIRLPGSFVLFPSFAVGYYNARKGLDLGMNMQFCSSLSLQREFGRRHRLGIGITHLSNGSFSDYNPGTEAITLSYSFPLDLLFHH